MTDSSGTCTTIRATKNAVTTAMATPNGYRRRHANGTVRASIEITIGNARGTWNRGSMSDISS